MKRSLKDYFHPVVKNSPSQFLRHPAYTGSIFTLLGIALCFRPLLAIAVTGVTSAVVYGYRIRVEEREMEENFGDSYRVYEQQTC
jgi:protein-S-isoprenylcysteine O-methyltransferase Ste14